VILDTRGTLLVLHLGRQTAKTSADASYVHFRVEKFKPAQEWLKSCGVKFVGEPFSPMADLHIVNFEDPDGNLLGIEGP
jgi:glyoxalase/bleomycin resistance protein/dioxygenase superfamily protein